MKKRKWLFFIIKAILLSVLFCSALYFENTQQQRLSVLVSVFLLYLAVGFVRVRTGSSSWYHLSFIADIALVLFLETNSRLLINYFFHSFYIVILLEAALTLPFKRGIAIGSATVLVSLIKYVYLIYYKFNLSNVSQLAFFLMVNGLILVIAGFAQRNKEEKERTDVLYKELLDAHRQLKQYTDEVNRLTVVEERNRIARDLHDTLGHNMTALIMQLQMAEQLLKEDADKAEGLLLNSTKTARESLAGVRAVVETLRGSVTSTVTVESIKSLVNDFSMNTGADIQLVVEGESGIQAPAANMALYHIIQEAMTNAVRHGKATKITVGLDYSPGWISFTVRDNGTGADIIREGYGLKGIKERVEALDGTVAYGCGEGFYISGSVHLPVEKVSGGKDDKSTVG
jgi:signal transduction histidine kinase